MSNPSSFHDIYLGYAPVGGKRPRVDIEMTDNHSLSFSKPIVQVIDAPFDGSAPRTLLQLCIGEGVVEGLHSLPLHSSGTARIFEVTVHSDFLITGLRDTKGPKSTENAREAIILYLRNTYGQHFEERQVFRWLNDPLLVNDIGSISSQWTQGLSGHDRYSYRLVNRASLQQHPLDHDLRPRDTYLTCVQDVDDRLIVITVNDVCSDQPFLANKAGDDCVMFQNPRMTTSLLSDNSCTALADGSLETFAKLLVLEFFLASIYLQRVDYYARLIYPKLPERERVQFSLSRNPHLQVPLGLFEPRLSANSEEAFQEIEDAEGILRSVNNLVDSITFVLSALGSQHIMRPQEISTREREARMQGLEDLCGERRQNAQRALEALNRQLDYLTKRKTIREANSVKRLTILASIYLPLSLAASILGMSTPFKKIAHDQDEVDDDNPAWLLGTNLLFDFFGLFITLASITIFILQAIKLGQWMKSRGLGFMSKRLIGPYSPIMYGRKWKFDGRGSSVFDFLRYFTIWWLGAGLLTALFVTFMVGMLTTAQSAWNTARILFAIYIGMGGSLILGCVLLYCWLQYKRL